MIKKLLSNSGFWNSDINMALGSNITINSLNSRDIVDNFIRGIQYQMTRISNPLDKCLQKDYICPISRLKKEELKTASVLTCCGTLEESEFLKNWLRGNGNSVCPYCRSYARYLTISTFSHKSLIESIEEFMINTNTITATDNTDTNNNTNSKQKLILIFCNQKLRNDLTFIIEKLNIQISWLIIDVENQIQINIDEMLEKYIPEVLLVGKLNSRSNFILELLQQKLPNKLKVTFC